MNDNPALERKSRSFDANLLRLDSARLPFSPLISAAWISPSSGLSDNPTTLAAALAASTRWTKERRVKGAGPPPRPSPPAQEEREKPARHLRPFSPWQT